MNSQEGLSSPENKKIYTPEEVKALKEKEQQELIIESFPGIGPNLAKNLLTKFKSVKKIINSSEEKLKKVEKIGQIKAKEIKKITDSKYL